MTSVDLNVVLHPTSKIGTHCLQPVLHQTISGGSNSDHHTNNHSVGLHIDLFLHSHKNFMIFFCVWVWILSGLNPPRPKYFLIVIQETDNRLVWGGVISWNKTKLCSPYKRLGQWRIFECKIFWNSLLFRVYY